MDKTTILKAIPIKDTLIEERDRRDYGGTAEWEDFKEDINRNGLICSIAVKALPEDKFKLLAGGRRLQACSELSHETINATVYTGEVDEADMALIEIIENLKRKKLLPEEEVRSKAKYLDLMQTKYGKKVSTNPKAPGVSLTEVARMLGETPANLSRDITLARAFEVMPELAQLKTKAEAFKAASRNVKKLREFKAVKEIKAAQKEDSDSPIQAVDNAYIVGDFLIEGKKISSLLIDLLEIDPPYAIELDKVKKQKDGIVGTATKDYTEVDYEAYEAFMRATLQEAFRIARNGAWLVLWFDIKQLERIHSWATEAGWKGRKIPGCWIKPTGQTNQPSLYLANAVEHFLYFRKGNASLNKEGRSNAFNYSPVSPARKTHPTERPIDLMEDIIETFVRQGSLICSPFLGSGKTILAAENLSCKCFGYDLSQVYKNSYTVRVHENKGKKYVD